MGMAEACGGAPKHGPGHPRWTRFILPAPGRPSTQSQQLSPDPQGSEGVSAGSLHPCSRPGTAPNSNG